MFFTGLDDEFRYWSYVEMHPAHVILTRPSTQEAADALHWSYTDRLLAHPQPIQPAANVVPSYPICQRHQLIPPSASPIPLSRNQPSNGHNHRFDVSRSVRNYSYGPVTTPHTDRRWFEYILPHGLRYFNNPRKSATTALDLRNFSKLD